MTERADLIVVGAGLAGSAAAWAAARRGLDVVVLEAFRPGHGNGSSHGSARIFRRVYSDALYVRMTGTARDLWSGLEDEAGETFITVTGGVDFGPARDPERLHETVTACGVRAELVPAQEARRRWPGFCFGPGRVLFHPEAGVLDPDRAMAAMLRLAARRGTRIHFGTRVTDIEPTGAGAVIRAEQGDFTAPAAVLAVGAWLEPLARDHVPLPELTVTQEQILHLRQRPPEGPWPTFIYDDGAACFYGLLGGRDGGAPGAVKIGQHHAGKVTTAATRDFAIDAGKRQRVLDFAARHLPGLQLPGPPLPGPPLPGPPLPGPPLPGLDNSKIPEATCLYTTTVNEDFILDRHGPFVVASACSGHGAKFAPLLGEIIADLASGRPSPDPRFTLAAHLDAQRTVSSG